MMCCIDILDHHTIKYEMRSRSSEISYLCPFHNDTHFGSAFFNIDDDTFFCFACYEGGNLTQFVAKLNNWDTKTAYSFIKNDGEKQGSYTLKSLNTFVDKQINIVDNKNKRSLILTKERLTIRFLEKISKKQNSSKLISQWYPIIVYLHSDTIAEKELFQIYDRFLTTLNGEPDVQSSITALT